MKINMTMTKRDKVLLIIISVVAVIFAFYYIIYQPTTEHVRRQYEREKDLQMELTVAQTIGHLLDETLISQEKVLADADHVIAAYYPIIRPQYFVDLFREFADEHEIILSGVSVEAPSLKKLSELIPKDQKTDDPLVDAIIAFNELSGDASEDPEMQAPSVEPGSIVVNTLRLVLYGGELEQYIAYLDSINNTGKPIYIAEYGLKYGPEDTLVMVVEVIVLMVDRLTAGQYIDDVSEFSFDVLPPAGLIDIFDSSPGADQSVEPEENDSASVGENE